MRILVVGGRSSLAQALIPVISDFAEVITAGRSGCDVYLDLCESIDNIEIPIGIDIVINTAASHGGTSFEEILRTEDLNVLGVMKLCQVCIQARIKHLILMSTIFANLDETSRFFNVYSLSKRHSDEVAQLFSTMFNLPLTILRPSQFYGAGEASRKHQPFLYTIMDKAENNEDILIFGSNDAMRNFIHIEDVASIISLVIRQKTVGTYTCMNVDNVSYSEIAGAAIDAFDSQSSVKFINDMPDILDNVFKLDDVLFKKIGFYPQISISDGMKKEAVYRRSLG